jgi:NAD(P)-dependent dehydrogenase (short-subunit alcohol dehydrogenase family)
MADFTGKVALVTGGSSGIGLACARMFAERGAKVLISDVADGRDAVEQIRGAGGQAAYVHADVSQENDNRIMVQFALDEYGRLDYAVNNAGIGGAQANVGDMTAADWNKVVGINLTGVFLGMKYEIPAILQSGGGAIVNMSSILGWVGFASSSAYVAAKHGVIGLTKTAALEYATQNLRVNAVSPGFISTPMLENAGLTEESEMGGAIASMHAMKRMGKPDEIASAVLWLCSSEASFVTGIALLVDGGYVAQ